MRTSVNAGFATLLGAPVTSPGYLIEIEFSTTLRFSTRGTITIGATTWTQRSFQVSGFPTPTITFIDSDNVIAAFLYNDKVRGRAIRIWKFDGEAPTATEYSQIQELHGDDFSINKRATIIRTVLKGADSVKEPDTRIVRNAVRQEIIEPGTKFFWGAELYTVE